MSVELEPQENEAEPQQELNPQAIGVATEMVKLWNISENSEEISEVHDKLFTLVKSVWSETYNPPFNRCYASFTVTHELDNTMFVDYRIFGQETYPQSILVWINCDEERVNCSVKEIQL